MMAWINKASDGFSLCSAMALPSSLPSSTANWHWKNKNITDWSRRWMDNELTSISLTAEKGIVSISAVTEMDGDVELGQRKSKYVLFGWCFRNEL